MAILFCHGHMEGDCRPRPYIFRGMLMGWRLCRDTWKWERGTLGCWDSERERPMRAPSLCTDTWWAALGKQIRTAQTGPEGRTRRDRFQFDARKTFDTVRAELSNGGFGCLGGNESKRCSPEKIKGALAPGPEAFSQMQWLSPCFIFFTARAIWDGLAYLLTCWLSLSSSRM